MKKTKISLNILLILSIALLIASPFTAIAETRANDPLNIKQYYLDSINAPFAWDYTTGSKDIVVAIIDTGVDINHPDLYENIWVNKDEIAGDKIDNDNNGYIDDINGWDFVHSEADPKPKFDDVYIEVGIDHGTLVAGIIGAQGNNEYGITGLNWQVSIMPLIALDPQGNGKMSDVIEALNYAIDNGADIINLSLVGHITTPELQPVINKAYQKNVLIVAAVGNEEMTSEAQTDYGINLTQNPRYPVCSDGEDNINRILGVGSIDINDKKSKFSNYGQTCLDINAPGETFYGLTVYQPTVSKFTNKFNGYWSGTSLSTPLVAGTAALIKSFNSSLANYQIRDLIIDNGVNINSTNKNFADLLGGGKVDLKNIFLAIKDIKNYSNIYALSQLTNSQGIVQLYDSQGAIINSISAFADYDGWLETKIADIDGDQKPEIIASSGKKNLPIKIFDWDGNLKSSITIDKLADNYRLAVLNNRIVVWQNRLIQIFAADSTLLSEIVLDTSISDISSADIDNDRYTELLVLSGNNILALNQLGIVKQSIVVHSLIKNMIVVGDYIVGSTGDNDKPYIFVYDFKGVPYKTFFAYNENFKGNIDLTTDGQSIITAPGKGGGPHIRQFDVDGNIQKEFFAKFNNLYGLNVSVYSR